MELLQTIWSLEGVFITHIFENLNPVCAVQCMCVLHLFFEFEFLLEQNWLIAVKRFDFWFCCTYRKQMKSKN